MQMDETVRQIYTVRVEYYFTNYSHRIRILQRTI